ASFNNGHGSPLSSSSETLQLRSRRICKADQPPAARNGRDEQQNSPRPATSILPVMNRQRCRATIAASVSRLGVAGGSGSCVIRLLCYAASRGVSRHALNGG